MEAAAKPAPVRAEEQTEWPRPGALTDPPPSREGPPPSDAWAKVRALALRQLDRFMALEPRVLRGDDPDAIHDIRVASRRLQQILDLLYPTPHGEVRKLRRRLRRARRVLGEVRNADVQLARVRKILRRKRTARRAAWEALHDYLVTERARHFTRAVGKLGELNLAVFYVRMKHLLGESGAPASGAETPGGETLLAASGRFEERVTLALARVWQAFDLQVQESHRDSRAPVIHAVRIAAKRLRYLTEVLQEFDVPGSSATLKWLRGVQELLGDWHDLEVLEQIMVAMVARPDFLRDQLEVAMEVQKLILKCRAEKGKFREAYFRQTLQGPEFQRVRDWAENLEL
jgi:CHAD domain-containing protein